MLGISSGARRFWFLATTARPPRRSLTADCDAGGVQEAETRSQCVLDGLRRHWPTVGGGLAVPMAGAASFGQKARCLSSNPLSYLFFFFYK